MVMTVAVGGQSLLRVGSSQLALPIAVLLAMGLGIAVLGWIDDRNTLSVKVRLLLQLIVALLTVLVITPVNAILVPFGGW